MNKLWLIAVFVVIGMALSARSDWTYSATSGVNVYLFENQNWTFFPPYLTTNGYNVSVNESALNATITKRAAAISDTNESSRIGNVAGYICSGTDKINGFYLNMTPNCTTDETGAGSVDYSAIQNHTDTECAAGEYVYGRHKNGTWICRADQNSGNYNDTWINATFYTMDDIDTIFNDYYDQTEVDSALAAQDACSEINGCVVGAITDGNTGWDNVYNFYNSSTFENIFGFYTSLDNFTGTLTDDRLCKYSTEETAIVCDTVDNYINDGNTGWDNTYGFVTLTNLTIRNIANLTDYQNCTAGNVVQNVSIDYQGLHVYCAADSTASYSDVWINDTFYNKSYIDNNYLTATVTVGIVAGQNNLSYADIASNIGNFSEHVGNINNLSYGQIQANIGNWSEDKLDYLTDVQTLGIIAGQNNLSLANIAANLGNYSTHVDDDTPDNDAEVPDDLTINTTKYIEIDQGNKICLEAGCASYIMANSSHVVIHKG